MGIIVVLEAGSSSSMGAEGSGRGRSGTGDGATSATRETMGGEPRLFQDEDVVEKDGVDS